MRHKEFNPLHVMREGNNKGWRPAPDPFRPNKAVCAHNYEAKHVFILADQVFYDVDATTGMLARSRAGQIPETFATQESDGYRPMFYRWLDKYVKKVEARVGAFLLTPAHITRTNELKQWAEKELILTMPDYWDDTVYEDLVSAIHRYLVDGVLYEYYTITLTSKDPVTVDKYQQLEDDYDDIKNYVCSTKPGSVAKIKKPF